MADDLRFEGRFIEVINKNLEWDDEGCGVGCIFFSFSCLAESSVGRCGGWVRCEERARSLVRAGEQR